MPHLCAFDTEDDSKGNCFLYNFYHVVSKKHFTFTDQIKALDFVCSRPNTEFWAVNLEYDLNNLFRDHMEMLEYCFAGSRLIYAELKEDRIKFLDTMNHWKFGVKAMGERLGMPKLEMKHGALLKKRDLNIALREINKIC